MKHESHEQQPGRDQRLTDYLCGELDPAAARALEAELAADPALQAQLAALRRALQLVRDDAPALTEGLPPARREALRAAAASAASKAAASRDGHSSSAQPREPAPAGRLHRIPAWMRAAAAALIIVGGLYFLQAQIPVLEDAARSSTEARLAADAKNAEFAKRQADALSALGYASSEPRVEALRLAPAPASEVDALQIAEEPLLEGRAFAWPTPPEFDLSLAHSSVLSAAPAPVGGAGGGAASGGAPGGAAATGLPQPPTSQPAAPARPASPGVPPPAEQDAGVSYDSAGVLDLLAVDKDEAARFGLSDEAQFAERGRAAGRPVRELADGYGRSYRDEDILGHLRRHGTETPRDMFFRYYGDNAAVRASEEPLSTFAADVDTASYALVRGYLTQGHLPPKAAVRTEEFVNSFKHELAPPRKGDFAVHLEAAPTLYGAPGSVLLRCGIKAREVSRAERKPLNLVFVVDKSGSMAEGNRLALVQSTLELLVDQIREDDTIGLVAFDSEAHEILKPTAGAERYKIREALRGLTSGGSTNAADGLFMGYKMAEGAFRKDAVNRVIIASDGVANTGETDQRKILEKVKRSAEANIDLTSIGVGMGNHNDAFLERLADEGEGSCHYVDTADEAKRVLVDGFTGAMQVVAREVKIQLEFDPEVVRTWRQLGYENRALRNEDFRNNKVDAGEVGAGHEVVALYELQLWPEAEDRRDLATLRLRWKPDGSREVEETETVLRKSETRARWGLASPRLRLAGTVAQFAEFMRRSVHARGDSYADLSEEAARLARELEEDAQVAEFRDLVARAAALVNQLWPEDDLALLIDEARRARLIEAELECVRERTPQVEELLKEARLQNEELEKRLQDLLQPR